MASGLRVVDGGGTVMWEIGDYSTRYVGTVDITLPAGQRDAYVGWAVDENNYFASIVQGLDPVTSQAGFNELVAIANNNNVQITALNGAQFYDRVVRVDIYKFS